MAFLYIFPYLVCAEPLGMENRQIGNLQIMASSAYSSNQGYEARLNNYRGWQPFITDRLAALKIDFGSYKRKITAVALQSEADSMITRYEISYSVDGWSWRHWIVNAREVSTLLAERFCLLDYHEVCSVLYSCFEKGCSTEA